MSPFSILDNRSKVIDTVEKLNKVSILNPNSDYNCNVSTQKDIPVRYHLEIELNDSRVFMKIDNSVLLKILRLKHVVGEIFKIYVSFTLKNTYLKEVSFEMNRSSDKPCFLSDCIISKSTIEKLEIRTHVPTLQINSSRINIAVFEIYSSNTFYEIEDTVFEKLNLVKVEYPKFAKLAAHNLRILQEFKYEEEFLQFIELRYFDIRKATSSSLDDIRKLIIYFGELGNKYDLLNAQSCEQKIIYNELNKKYLNNTFSEKILLFLNLQSNEFGINWFRGILFTLVFSIIGSIILYYSLYEVEGPYNYLELSPNFKTILFENFSPIYKVDLLREKDANIFIYILHFFIKIMVFYGIYQTVQAFRKHRR